MSGITPAVPAAPTDRSGQYFERAQRVIPGGVNSPVRAFRSVGGTPRFMVSASGPYITDADGLTTTVYFSSLDKLPVRQVFKRRNEQFKDFDKEETIFAKYRDVGGGVKWPLSIRRFRNSEIRFAGSCLGA